MSKGKGSKSLVFMSGVILGSVVGAAVAVLFAPTSGDATREKIVIKGKKALKDVKAEAKKVGSQLAPTVENLRQEFDERFDDLKKGFDKGIKRNTPPAMTKPIKKS